MTADATTEARFRRLEMEVRRMRWVSAGALTLVGVVCLTSMQSKPANDVVTDTVTTKKLRVVDDGGQLLAELALDPRTGPADHAVSLRMIAADRETVCLRTGTNGSELRLANDNAAVTIEAVENEGTLSVYTGPDGGDHSQVAAWFGAGKGLGALYLSHVEYERPTKDTTNFRQLGVATLTPCEGLQVR